MSTAIQRYTLPTLPQEPLSKISVLIDKVKDLSALFKSLSKEEIEIVLEKLVESKNPSTLFYICHIPDEKLESITRSVFLSAVELCNDQERFINKVSANQLKFFTRFLKEALSIPILKANNLSAKLNEKCRGQLICLPPLLLLIAIKDDMDLVALTRFLSPKQLRYLVCNADESYLQKVASFLIKNQYAIQLYTFINALDPNSDIYRNFAIQINIWLTNLTTLMKEEMEEVRAIKQSLEKRKTKSGVAEEIPIYFFLLKKEAPKLYQLTNSIKIYQSFWIDACIASVRNSPDLSRSGILNLDKLVTESEILLRQGAQSSISGAFDVSPTLNLILLAN